MSTIVGIIVLWILTVLGALDIVLIGLYISLVVRDWKPRK